MQIDIKQARKKGYYLEIKKDGKIFIIHNRYDPRAEAQKWWNQIKNRIDGKNVILFGGGAGYFSELVKRNTQNCTIIELLPRFEAINGFSFKDGRFFLEEHNTIENILKLLPSKQLMNSIPIVHPGYQEVFPRLLPKVHNDVILTGRKILRERQSTRRFFWLWFDNFLEILPEIETMSSLTALAGSREQTPALLVGAGPSLSDSLDWVARVQDRVTIIAADTALSSLQSKNIRADFAITIDPQQANAEYLQGVKPATNLVASWSARQEYFDWAKNKLRFPVYISSGLSEERTVFPLSAWFKRFVNGIDFLQSGGSVSATGLDFAQYLHCNPIGIVGIDHGYPDMRGGASGSLWEQKQISNLNRFTSLADCHIKKISDTREVYTKKLLLKESIRGNKIYTTDEYISQNNWFEEAGRNLPARCCDFRADGLRMKNWEVIKSPLKFFKSNYFSSKDNLKPLKKKKITVDWQQFQNETEKMLRSLKETNTPPPRNSETQPGSGEELKFLIANSFYPFEDSPDSLETDPKKNYAKFKKEFSGRLQKLLKLIRQKTG
ncbi:MAG: motility associated factor glycosyltransferase family protein [bacterium]